LIYVKHKNHFLTYGGNKWNQNHKRLQYSAY
jgi:hypothetical protein